MEECFLAAMALNLERIVDAIFSSLILIFCRKTWGAAEFFLLSTDPILDITPYIKCNCFYFEVKQLKCILNILKYTKWIFLLHIIYQSDMKIHLIDMSGLIGGLYI